jgi:hypothetical protein
MGRTLALVLVATVAACGRTDVESGPNLRVERIARLEKIAATCGLPGTLKLVGTEDVRFRPSPSAKYERVDCVLNALKKTDIPIKMGFVGNEAYDIGNQQ